MRKKISQKVFISIILLVVCISGICVFAYYSKGVEQTGGEVLKANKSMSFDCESNYKYLEFKLNIDATNCKNIVTYYIKDPSGNVIDYGQVDPIKRTLSIDKLHSGKKGIWHIEFANVADGETVRVTYTIEARNTKKSKAITQMLNI